MKLYGSYTSPFVRKCRITAIETGLAERVEFISTVVMDDAGDHPNPLNMVPSLTTDDGDLIVDSRVICDHLVTLGSGLADGSDWSDRTLVAMADGLTDRAVAMALERRRPDVQQSADWQSRRESAIRATLPELQRRRPSAFTPGAVALTCALGYLDFRHPGLDWREDHAELSDWYAAQQDRASVRDTEHPR
ncbi:MAG: glutathione S-transferase N-terminal domain-containing protein [Litorimonas sp.]